MCSCLPVFARVAPHTFAKRISWFMANLQSPTASHIWRCFDLIGRVPNVACSQSSKVIHSKLYLQASSTHGIYNKISRIGAIFQWRKLNKPLRAIRVISRQYLDFVSTHYLFSLWSYQNKRVTVYFLCTFLIFDFRHVHHFSRMYNTSGIPFQFFYFYDVDSSEPGKPQCLFHHPLIDMILEHFKNCHYVF